MSNLCVFTGNLGKEPNVKYLPSGKAVAVLSIAVTKKFKDKDGNQQEITTWVRCVAFDRLAEICEKYLTTGSKIYVQCEYRLNKWKDKDGKDQYTPEFIMQEMEMLSPKSEKSDPAQHASGNRAQQNPTYENSKGAPSKVTQVNNDHDDFNDDIPF